MSALEQTDINKLKKAIARGVLRVEYANESVTYQSVDQMLKALAFAEAEFAGSSAVSRVPSTLAVFGRD